MSKFYEEVCLLDQPFIRENTISVADLIKTVAAKIGGYITVVRFVRYKVGDIGDAPGVRESPLPANSLSGRRGAMPGYRRILLKISGEALAGPLSFGLDPGHIRAMAGQVAEVARAGVQIGLVLGRRQYFSRGGRGRA